MIDKARYALHIDLPSTGRIQAADIVIIEDHGHVEQVGFRYRPEYLELPSAIAIDPICLPLSPKERAIACRGGLPAFLDDYLPDAWGRRVLSYAVLKKTGEKMNANSAIACLNALRRSRIGALELTAVNEQPLYQLGIAWEELAQAEKIAHQIDTLSFEEIPAESLDLIYLANEGSGAGGARPKSLVYRGDDAFLAKFNRLGSDQFNVARVELACLKMAKAAGLRVYGGELIEDISGRDVLLLQRFDISGSHRRHLISINGLRKDAYQRDDVGVFRYDDIHRLLQSHSTHFREDAEQLLRQMLFNRAINNTDDHERNFSMINDGSGYRLSPAYDLVPSLTTGAYHVAGYQYSPYPPKPSEIINHGKVFGLDKTTVKNISDQIIDAIQQWKDFASECKVSDPDYESITRLLAV
ncbi:Uncharacterised protein [Zhongshania aliphaticivorans]|uniref:Phosphatidylinositol kinase n=1 Tax=Zhongshania aliphaticivorans TaxID=1470434 RepID=A0A5S9MUU0_9GAMM|nr:type II toxin-antitoxin system HipA family toxin [Zhongshania aliphaticivorans]CAA0080826.1 Uncharacterised protein [Zhongshania aliphaticivorans]CAA0085461.1 Uncharacterised protein [Zhongshania aliphaticivorans]